MDRMSYMRTQSNQRPRLHKKSFTFNPLFLGGNFLYARARRIPARLLKVTFSLLTPDRETLLAEL